jgi:hypothetical protein
MNSKFAMITFLDSPPNLGNQPDNSLPGQPVYPSNGLPSYPGGPTQLPVYPFDPTLPSNELPENGGSVDNSLPRPGKRYIVKWLACVGLILVPDNSLPETPEPK